MDDVGYCNPAKEMAHLQARVVHNINGRGIKEGFPEYESRGMVKDLLSLHEEGAITDGGKPARFSNWTIDLLRRLDGKVFPYSDRERLAVFEIGLCFDVGCWQSLPAPDKNPATVAEAACMAHLGIKKTKGRTRRVAGQDHTTSGEIGCPVCQTGAVLSCWTSRGGRLSFLCQNRHCVKKI